MQSVSRMFEQHIQHSDQKDLALFNCSILAFAITIVIPLSLGMTKLPVIVSCPVFIAGFISLFGLALQNDRKNTPQKLSKIDNFKNFTNSKNTNLKEKKSEKYHPENEVPFELVRQNVNKILLSYNEYIDDATKNKLIDVCNKLEKI